MYILLNRSINLIKKVLRQDHYFSTRLPYADKTIGEIWMNMINNNYNATEDMNIRLRQLKDKAKLKFIKIQVRIMMK